MTLYEINAALEEAFMDCIDPETGEIVGDTEQLDALQIQRDVKIENIVLMIKNYKAEADAIKAEENNLAKRRKTCENRTEWLRKYLAYNLQGEEFKTARATVSYRKTQSVQVDDVWKLPKEFVKVADPVPDKRALAEALKEGREIDGAELITNINMLIK